MRQLFFIFFLFFFLRGYSSDIEAQLKRADWLYTKGIYEEAGEIYDSLVNSHYYTKEVLFRMAYIAERFEKNGEAIFFLRKIMIEYGDKEADKRIGQLIEKSGVEGVLSDEGLSYFDFLNRNSPAITLGVMFFLGLVLIYYYYNRNKSHKYIGKLTLIAFILATFIEILLITSNYSRKKRCVLIRQTTLYESPSYGDPSKEETFALGSVLNINDRQDIWYQVSADKKTYWLPFFSIREL